MAKVSFNYPVESIRGKVAEGTYFNTRNGHAVITKYDVDQMKNRTPSEAQLAVREKFTIAANNARLLLSNDATKADLQEEFVKSGSNGTLFGYVYKLEYAKLQ